MVCRCAGVQGLGSSPRRRDRFAERVIADRALQDAFEEVFGEELGCIMFRKVAPWYAKRFGPAKPFSKQVVTIATRSQFREILDAYLGWRRQFVDDAGELLPRYQLPPMVASFMEADDESAVARRTAVPVPSGPVEVW